MLKKGHLFCEFCPEDEDSLDQSSTLPSVASTSCGHRNEEPIEDGAGQLGVECEPTLNY